MSERASCSGSQGGQYARMWERMISGMSVISRKTASTNCASPAEALGSTAMGTLEDMVCCEVFSRSYKCYFSFRVPFLHEHLRKVVIYTGTPGPPVKNVRTTPCRARPTCLSSEPNFVRTQPTFHKFRAKVCLDSRSDLPPIFGGPPVIDRARSRSPDFRPSSLAADRVSSGSSDFSLGVNPGSSFSV